MKNQLSVYQISPSRYVESGRYYTEATVAELQDKGNFGIGAFAGIDGELVMIDDVIYHGDAQSRLIVADPNTRLATATISPALTDVAADIDVEVDDLEIDLKNQKIDQFLARLFDDGMDYSVFYAIHIQGKFKHVASRSLLKQENGPLDLSKQPVTDLTNIEGDLVGFYTPSYMKNAISTGLHLHFIDSNRTVGGHVDNVIIATATVRMQKVDNLSLDFFEYKK